MNYKNILIAILSVIVIVFVVNYSSKTNEGLKGIQDGQAYNSTTTESFGTGGAYKAQVLKSMAGQLGNIIVTLTSNANLYLCDATTTGSQMGIGFSTTTQCIATFKTTTVGSYNYEGISFTKGLIAISNTTVGMASSTISWR